MGIFRSLAGTVLVELTTAAVSESLEAAARESIQIFQVTQLDELTFRFAISRNDCKALKTLCLARGEKMVVVKRNGIYWSLKRLLQRRIMLLGVSVFIFLALWLPSRVLFVRVEGNIRIPARLILEAARESGICFGASRRQVRSEQVKNRLLEAVPDLGWAGVNTSGCTAVISVREKPAGDSIKKTGEIVSVIACRDGIVLSATATAGNLLCSPGQAVQAGQILISPYTDCGLTVTASRAEGEIIAATKRNLQVVTPSEGLNRGTETDTGIKFSLIFGKKRIYFYKGSGISDATCVKMYTEYTLTLPGGFQLPVRLLKEELTASAVSVSAVDAASAESMLTAFAATCLKEQMIAGCITAAAEYLTDEQAVYRLTGSYACTEMIGRVLEERIGELHEQND